MRLSMRFAGSVLRPSRLHARTDVRSILVLALLGSGVLGCSVDDPERFTTNHRVAEIRYDAAGAVVPPGKVVDSGELWLGNPAKPVRRLSDKEIEQLYYSAKHYVRLKDAYLAG